MADSTDSTAVNDAAKEPESTPNEIFKRMVMNDKLQNKSLASKVSKGNGFKSKGKDGQQPQSTKMRFVVCTLGVLAMAMAQMSRGVMNYCITSMVDPSMLQTVENVVINATQMPNDISSISETIEPEISTSSGSTLQFDEAHLAPSDEANSEADVKSWDSTLDPLLYYMTTETNSMIPDAATTIQVSTETQTIITSGEDATTVKTDQVETTTVIKEHIETTTTIEEPATTVPDPSPQKDKLQVDKFMWTIPQQSLVKGGFFYSYFFFMILGGRMSEIYGAKYVILIGVLGSALINLCTPWMARNSFVLLVASRILMGAIQSGIFPAMYALVARWLTMSEASIYAPMIKMNLRVGQMLASLIPGLIREWPNVFYTIGLVGLIWSALFMFLATSDPSTNKWVSQAELKHIMKKKRKPKVDDLDGIKMAERKVINGVSSDSIKSDKQPVEQKQHNQQSTPWVMILTSPSVIGLVVVKFTYNLCADFLSVELPSYLKFVHLASREKISTITTAMFAIQVVLIVVAGWLAKEMIKRRPFNMSKTSVRKFFQSLASFGTGGGLALIAMNDFEMTYAALMLQIISFFSIFAAGGETMVPYDLSDQYPATIMAIANSVANLSGIAVTSLTGLILGKEGGSHERWHRVIGLIAAADIVGGIIFFLLIKAKPIDFEKRDSTSKKMDIEQALPKIKVEAPKQEAVETDGNNNQNAELKEVENDRL